VVVFALRVAQGGRIVVRLLHEGDRLVGFLPGRKNELSGWPEGAPPLRCWPCKN
jgi:hypothetical protein